MLKKTLLWAVGCLMVLTAAGSVNAQASKEITVSAAISLKNAFEEIGTLFESRNKGVKVVFNFGASGDLVKQIEGGAPVDVFASAAQKDMDQIEQKGLIDSFTRFNFVKNTVVLIQSLSSTLEIKGFEDLLKPEVKMISIGNPQTVPAGKYAQEVFTRLKVWDGISHKLVLAENVRQVLDYVTKNEVDAGVVYATDAAVQTGKIKIVATAPSESHKPVVYPVAVLKGSKNEALAKAFVAMLKADEGMNILKKYGFESAR
ncbi:MAG: molybdate ABC transporter substrate-binding protein [Deltaproteobacteria bacterium]|nr:molybdate ABC transporter substrate-binding protein [Deltaproteobacteria bacterium]